MKFSIEKKDIASKIAHLVTVVPSKNAMAILTTFLLLASVATITCPCGLSCQKIPLSTGELILLETAKEVLEIILVNISISNSIALSKSILGIIGKTEKSSIIGVENLEFPQLIFSLLSFC